MISGVPACICTALMTPVARVPFEELTMTVRPRRLLACIEAMPDCMVWVDCKELNCANCATKSVAFCGFKGSCEVIWVTSSFKKSDCPSACFGLGTVEVFAVGVVKVATGEIAIIQAQVSQPRGLELTFLLLRERTVRPASSGRGNSPGRSRFCRDLFCAGWSNWREEALSDEWLATEARDGNFSSSGRS